MVRADAMQVYDAALESYVLTTPWNHESGAALYEPDYTLLEQLLTLAIRAGVSTESGVFAKGVDLWIASEFRRAGFADPSVWPRPRAPRVIARDVADLIDRLPATAKKPHAFPLRTEVARRAMDAASVTPVDAHVLGRAYLKQIDVCISDWRTGPELLVSTKTQIDSFAKNLPNRFEEALGDAENLAVRHPFAALGYVFAQRSTIISTEPDAFERSKDMIDKLRRTSAYSGYTSTCLLLLDWEDDVAAPSVRVVVDPVPDDVRPPAFFDAMIRRVLASTPVTFHKTVRERLENRVIPVDADDAD